MGLIGGELQNNNQAERQSEEEQKGALLWEAAGCGGGTWNATQMLSRRKARGRRGEVQRKHRLEAKHLPDSGFIYY